MVICGLFNVGSQDSEGTAERKRKRRSRWGGGEHEKIFIPGMPTILPANLNKDQEQAYLCKYLTLFCSIVFLVSFNLNLVHNNVQKVNM